MLYDPDSRHVTNLFRTVNESENRKLRTEEISYDLLGYCSVIVVANKVYVTLVAVRS